MWYFIFKVLLSAVLIGAISEISKRSSLFGSILASVPLTSILAIIWLYTETKDIEKITNLSYDIFWLVIPSLSFFIAFPLLLKTNLNFYISMILAILIMIVLYFGMIFLLNKFGIKL
ncbi:hypothetical protein MASR1M45_03190 [Candidatus Kapaibacterium sp.]